MNVIHQNVRIKFMDTVYIHNDLCEDYRLSIYVIRLFMAEDSSNNCKLRAIKVFLGPF